MYGLPLDTDLSFFRGRQLRQLCIGCNEAILKFGDHVSLTIQTDIGHKSTARELIALYKMILPAVPMLVSLINSTVTNACAIPPGTLALEFSNGDILEIYDSSSEFESYQIWHDNHLIVV